MQGCPAYPYRHAGTLLILGSAPCALEDFEAALELYPDAAIMAINEAAGLLPVNFIASLHAEKMERFRKLQEDKFGTGHFTTHGAAPDVYFPSVDYYWHGAHCGATSAWAGVRIAKMMGFELLVLCGCPMNGGDGYIMPTWKTTPQDPRFGFESPVLHPVMASYKAALAGYVKAGEGAGVLSMSGYSRQLLGVPKNGSLARPFASSARCN